MMNEESRAAPDSGQLASIDSVLWTSDTTTRGCVFERAAETLPFLELGLERIIRLDAEAFVL
jgi:hypothetical protein